MGCFWAHDEVRKSLVSLLAYPQFVILLNLQLFVFVVIWVRVFFDIAWNYPILCRFIYTGSVQVTSEIAQDVLRAADQYLLEGLKRLCEYTIAKVIYKIHSLVVFKSLIRYYIVQHNYIILAVLQDVNLDNVSDMYDLSEAFHAVSLRHTCILYILEHFNKICTRTGYFLSPQIFDQYILLLNALQSQNLNMKSCHSVRLSWSSVLSRSSAISLPRRWVQIQATRTCRHDLVRSHSLTSVSLSEQCSWRSCTAKISGAEGSMVSIVGMRWPGC
jgi:hypothetical protein